MNNKDQIQPVSIEQAEQITADIVMPMLQLVKMDFSLLKDGEFVNPEPGEMMASISFDATIQCLHYWQGIVAALAMKMSAQNVLAYLMSIYSVDMDLMKRLNDDILIADDNIKLMTEKLLEYGIKM